MKIVAFIVAAAFALASIAFGTLWCADLTPDEIAARIGARNSAQVERLVSGQTYSRIS